LKEGRGSGEGGTLRGTYFFTSTQPSREHILMQQSFALKRRAQSGLDLMAGGPVRRPAFDRGIPHTTKPRWLSHSPAAPGQRAVPRIFGTVETGFVPMRKRARATFFPTRSQAC